ncbi:MAG: hypothetical protein MI892_22080 [Desulfobacterales bacterium]|nr:hypothetical protein [Desulfobacterales bacterium]
MKYNVFGRSIEIIKSDEKWKVFILGRGGKRQPAHNIFIPSDIAEKDIENWLEDLLHEWASPQNDKIIKLK